ncbi:hypothetical protein DENSPDRAFT_840216 [Dentipellis sp. KUC8613]|nr:hypothetical protein DENSPDRAFT_840216 [Dentipellis sp. KUC8613]
MKYTVQRVEEPSEELINECTTIFTELMKDDIAIISLCGGDPSLLPLMSGAMLRAGARFGEFYTATSTEPEAQGRVVGYTMWMPPGRDLFDSEEQRKMGLTEFMERMPEAGKEYYKSIYMVEWPKFVNKVLGPTGKTDSWWMHMAMVRPEYQKQGIATALMKPVRDKATRNKETLAWSTTSELNVRIYLSMDAELKGGRMMPSPWGRWPLYVFEVEPPETVA